MLVLKAFPSILQVIASRPRRTPLTSDDPDTPLASRRLRRGLLRCLVLGGWLVESSGCISPHLFLVWLSRLSSAIISRLIVCGSSSCSTMRYLSTHSSFFVNRFIRLRRFLVGAALVFSARFSTTCGSASSEAPLAPPPDSDPCKDPDTLSLAWGTLAMSERCALAISSVSFSVSLLPHLCLFMMAMVSSSISPVWTRE